MSASVSIFNPVTSRAHPCPSAEKKPRDVIVRARDAAAPPPAALFFRTSLARHAARTIEVAQGGKLETLKVFARLVHARYNTRCKKEIACKRKNDTQSEENARSRVRSSKVSNAAEDLDAALKN